MHTCTAVYTSTFPQESAQGWFGYMATDLSTWFHRVPLWVGRSTVVPGPLYHAHRCGYRDAHHPSRVDWTEWGLKRVREGGRGV